MRRSRYAVLLASATLTFFSDTFTGEAAAQSPGAAESPTASTTAPLPPSMGEGVAIEVNGMFISSYDVYQRVKWLLFWSRLKPTREVLRRLEDEARRMLADEALQTAELRRINPTGALIASNRLVEERIELLARQRKMSSIDLLSGLIDEGIESETLYSMVRAQISWEGYIQYRYGGGVWIDPARVASRREQLQANANKDLYRIREIIIPRAPRGGRQGGIDFAEALWREIVSGKISLGEVAEQFSDSPSASKGGEIGWVALNDLPADTRTVVAQMGPGQIAPPIETDDQYIIYYVEDVAPAGGQTRYDLIAVFSPSLDDTAGVVERLSSLKAGSTCSSLKERARVPEGFSIVPIDGATASTISSDFREWVIRANEGQASPVISTASGIGYVQVCRRYKAPLAVPSDDQLREELYVARLINVSRSELNRLRQRALISQRY